MDIAKQAGILAICWAVGVPLAYGLAWWWWEFNNAWYVILPVSFVLGLILRFAPHNLDELI